MDKHRSSYRQIALHFEEEQVFIGK